MKQFVVNEKKLRKRMIDCDVKTINDLSVISKVSKPTIYDYINGKSPFSDAFMRFAALEKRFPSHIHMCQLDKRGLGKLHFKTEQNAESRLSYSKSTTLVEIDQILLDFCSKGRDRARAG